jgi:radical SAM protein with 4Fe4S-binding SPASM domain
MTPSTERAVITASLLTKFARFTEPQKHLARQVMICRSCASQAVCSAGCRFLGDLVALPACPLGRAAA